MIKFSGRFLAGFLILGLTFQALPAYALREQQKVEGSKSGLEEIVSATGLEEGQTVAELAGQLRMSRGFGFVNPRDRFQYSQQVGADSIANFVLWNVAGWDGLIPKVAIQPDDWLGLEVPGQLRFQSPSLVAGVAIREAAQVPAVLEASRRRNLIISAPVSAIGEIVERVGQEGAGVGDRVLVIAKVKSWEEVEAADQPGVHGVEVEPAVGAGATLEDTVRLLERIGKEKHFLVWGSAGGVNAENVAALLSKGHYVGFSVGPELLWDKPEWFEEAKRRASPEIPATEPAGRPAAGLEENIPLAPGLTAKKVVFIAPAMASPQLFQSLKSFKPAPGEQLPLVIFVEHDFHVEKIQGWLNQAGLRALEIVNVKKEVEQHKGWNLFDVVAAKQAEYYLGTGADIHTVWFFEDLKNLGRFLGVAPIHIQLWEKSLERQYGTQA
ncbi:MAG: hypothetical protein HYZ93_05270 [Candidatus Omnitrophica bacterium]|nr:hypothetical protein [Candidatus Omnitrophota bacterium]